MSVIKNCSSGIYIIVNSRNDKFYIGSTNDFEVRKKSHFKELRGGYHGCDYLQNAYNKEKDKSVFIFEPILYCSSDKETLLKIEQFFLDMHKYTKERGILYNSSMIAARPEMTLEIRKKIGDAHRGIAKSIEHKLKISAAREGSSSPLKGIPLSEETKAKMSAVRTGKPSPLKGISLSKETRLKMSLTKKGRPSPLKGMPSGRKGIPVPKRQGSSHGRSKLTEGDVIYIRTSQESHAELERQFGVTDTTIANIRKRRTWKHI